MPKFHCRVRTLFGQFLRTQVCSISANVLTSDVNVTRLAASADKFGINQIEIINRRPKIKYYSIVYQMSQPSGSVTTI